MGSAKKSTTNFYSAKSHEFIMSLHAKYSLLNKLIDGIFCHNKRGNLSMDTNFRVNSQKNVN